MKYRSMENRFCMSLVAFAVIVRLLLATGVSAALDSAVGLAPKPETPDEPDVFLLEILEPERMPDEPPAQPQAPDEPDESPEQRKSVHTGRFQRMRKSQLTQELRVVAT